QRFSRRRGELYGEAAAKVYGDVRFEDRAVRRRPSGYAGHASASPQRGCATRSRRRKEYGLAETLVRLRPAGFAGHASPSVKRGCATRSRRRSVEPGGFEPPTSSLRTTRSTN